MRVVNFEFLLSEYTSLSDVMFWRIVAHAVIHKIFIEITKTHSQNRGVSLQFNSFVFHQLNITLHSSFYSNIHTKAKERYCNKIAFREREGEARGGEVRDERREITERKSQIRKAREREIENRPHRASKTQIKCIETIVSAFAR